MSQVDETEPVRIVHLEDDPNDRELVRETLDAGGVPFSLVTVSTREEFTEALDDGSVDLILSDFALPSFDGLAALAIARRVAPDVPFVLVSGTIGEDAAIESLTNGATDYVLKHRLTRLVPAVRRALEEASERRTRKLAESALARERTFLLALLNSLEAGVVACDSEGRVTLMNRATRELHGFQPGELPGPGWLEKRSLLGADGKVPLQFEDFPLNRALRGEELQNVEISIRAHDGALRSMLVGGRPILDTNGGKLGAVVAIHDVTERKELELQFRQSQKMEAMGALAAGVAHDFNNLLTAILGFGQLLEAQLPKGSAELDYTEEVLKAAGRASALTRQLLAFTRQQVLEPKIVDVNEVVADVEKLLRKMMGVDVRLVTIPGTELGKVKADPGQLQQVLMNLAVNARDAMPDGGKLTIETANVTVDETQARGRIDMQPGDYVVLNVSDSGCGMSADVAARIFEPFYTTKEVGKGTGLGLSTVHGIVKQSEGHIEVISEPGQGTTFRIHLPRVTEEAEVSVHPSSPIPRYEGAESILLVDDEESIRRVLRHSLQARGYTVIEAADCAEALAVAEHSERRIDLLITDVVMPRMSGPELAERIALIRPDVRTLFMSGYTENAMVHEGSRREGSAYLQKPFTPDVLAHRVRELLDAPRRKAA